MSKAKNILFIDDDDFVRELIAEQIVALGYQVTEASEGSIGLKKFIKLKPDVVLLDLRMPKLDGLTVLESLVKNAPDTPVIIVSGQGTMEDVVKALRLGAWDYLIKPILDFELLTHSIETVHERASLLKENKQNRRELEELNIALENKVERRTAQLKQTLKELDSVNASLKAQNIESIKVLSQIIEMHPGIYKGHAKFVAEKSVLIAKEIGLDDNQIQTIMVAGLLLQIGKMSLSEKMLTKPFYTLSKVERQDFLKHAIEGEKLLKGLSHLQDPAYLIRCQYEKYDGTGVPNGLQGERIPVGARIIKIIQDYSNYQNGVTTGKKMLSRQIFSKMELFKEKDYDPQILELFINIASGGPYKTQHIIVDAEWYNLHEGMHVVEVKHAGTTFLKNHLLKKEDLDHIKELREVFGDNLQIKVQVR
ncbi:MAG: response regulator [Gammaproteobacteria bacterium]|nr:response regulator [Gammaproteobacteria bacterium]